MLWKGPAVHCIVMGRDSSHIHFQGGGWQPTLQPFLQERKHYSNCSASGVFSARRTPVREQTPLQCIGLPCRSSSSLSDGLYHSLWETTQVCRVPSRSHTWRFHRSGRGCHMVPSPWERRSFLRGMHQGGAVARRMSSGNQVWVGQNGSTSRTCSSSSLTLHSVCASRLTGGNAYLHRARGQLCASASVPRGPSVREKYSWQWEDSQEANRSTWASPNRLQISQIVSGWSRHSPGKVSCRESASAARLSSPGMWTARSDLSRVWLQRRRWRASCDMRRDRISPIRLMYDTAAVLSVRTNTCLPNSSARNCRKARCTANSSRQLMCQSSRGPVQSLEAACPLHVAPQPVLEASVVTTTCRDTCSKGTLARRKARSVQGLKEQRHSCVMFTRSVPRCHAHLGTRECNQCWSGLIWSNPSSVTAAADAICPRSLWNCFSRTTVLPLKELRQFSTDWVRSSMRRAVILTESNSTPRKEILCTGESLLFSQLTRSPNWLRCRSTRSLWSHNCSRARAMLETVEDPDAHFP